MNAIKKIALGMLVALTFSMTAHAETWVIHAEKNFPPYNYTENGKFIGLDTEIVELVLSELKISPNYKFAAWDEVVKSVDDNQTHLAFQFAPKPERFEKYNMAGPHRIGKTVLAVPADSEMAFSNMNDLKGQSVGVVAGYSYMDEFDQNKEIKKVDHPNNLAALKSVASKEVGVMIGDMHTIAHLAKTNGLQDKIRILPTVLKEVPRYIAFPKDRKADADRFSAKLKELTENGQIESIIQKWASRS